MLSEFGENHDCARTYVSESDISIKGGCTGVVYVGVSLCVVGVCVFAL